MQAFHSQTLPPHLDRLEQATRSLGFTMGSDYLTGSLLRTLAASKPSGQLLELGTGTGLATAWLLDGLGSQAHLTTVDQHDHTTVEARQALGVDGRVTFVQMDGQKFIFEALQQNRSFDLIFADMPPGKFQLLAETLRLLRVGGFYIIDDLLPQPKWASGHQQRVDALVTDLQQRPDFSVTSLDWSTGLLIATRKS